MSKEQDREWSVARNDDQETAAGKITILKIFLIYPNRGSDYLFLKSPRFHACMNSAHAAGLKMFIGGVCPR